MHRHALAVVLVCACGGSQAPTRSAAIAAPRQVAPLSSTVLTGARPNLRWQLAPGTDGADVELCADRACTHSLAKLAAPGSSAVLAADLPPGVAFWRLRGRHGNDVGSTTSATWELIVPRHAAARASVTGASGIPAPDYNGDGYADLVIGSPWTGVAEMYFGKPGGVSAPVELTVPGLKTLGQQVGDAGDSNGDGFDDLALGIYGGTTYGFAGGAQPPFAHTSTAPNADASMFVEQLGQPSDLDGDGYADLVILAAAITADDSTGAPRPAVEARIYLGSAGGFGHAAPSAVIRLAPLDADHNTPGLVLPGDLDGDGYGDLVLATTAAPHELLVYRGGPHGLDTPPDHIPLADIGADVHAVWLAPAGDVNGDGRPDIIVGARVMNGMTLALTDVRVFAGGPGGLAHAPLSKTTVPADAPLELATGVGDVNHDGFGDVLAVSPADSAHAYVYLGSEHGLAGSPAFTLDVPDSNTMSGIDLAAGRDFDGDGNPDIVIVEEGSVWIYLGGPQGPPSKPTTVLHDPHGDDGGRFGIFAN